MSELPTAHQRWRVFPPDIKILLNLSNIINVVTDVYLKCHFTNKYDINCVFKAELSATLPILVRHA